MEAREIEPSADGRTARTRRRWAVFAGLAIAVVVADQLTKGYVDATYLVTSSHAPTGSIGGPTPVIGDLVRIAKSYNSGGIFGLFGASAPVLAVASLAVISLIVVYHYRAVRAGPALLSVTLGLLLGGAVGNLIDRVRFQHVVDFVDMGIGDLRFYTFNVADSAISISIVLLLLLSVLGEGRRGAHPVAPGGNEPAATTDPGASTDPAAR